MAIDFPSTSGQLTDGSFRHTASGVTWSWDGEKWNKLGGNLDYISDVSITSAATGDVLRYNGSLWVDAVLDYSDLSGTPTTVSTFTNDANYITSAGAPVQSVNTQTGSVVLDADDIDDTSTTHKFATAAQLSLADSALQSGDNISLLTNNSGYITSASVATLTDVTLTSLASTEFLRYNGTAWVNTGLISSDIPDLATTKITSGTFADARISESSVTQHQGALSITENQISDLQTYALSSTVTEIDGNANDLITLTGVAENATDLGTFTGGHIAASETIKGALQDLSDAIGANTDADTVDGLHAAQFLRSDADDTTTGDITISKADPTINLTNTTASEDDFAVKAIDGGLYVTNVTDTRDDLIIDGDGVATFAGNLNASAGLDVTGNITVTGTVDGRDVATDGTKLDGIEANATADQTDAEIKTAYENNADTNAFTDAEQTKLAGIAAGAEVNVDTNLGVTTTTTTNVVTSSTGTDATLNEATSLAAGLMSTTHHDKLDGIEANATADQTDAEIKTAYENNADTNAFTDDEKTKLAGIATGAEVNVATDLGVTTTTTTNVVTSSTGTDATLNEATSLAAGLMSTTHHDKLDGIAAGADVSPTVVSAFTNDSGYITGYTVTSGDVTAHQGDLTIGQSQVTNLTTDLGNKADLVGGVVPVSQIPSIAITEYLGTAANATALIALTGQKGDWAIRTDTSSTWVITANDGSTITDWVELETPSSDVNSVNSQTGTVVLDADDIDDTSTTHKFATAAQLTKLDGVETGATADQTDAEIKTAYENNLDTNAFTDAEQTKLAGIAAGAEVNVATNLGVTTTTTSNTITSSTGTNATIGEATGSAAGLMSTAHHDKLDGIAAGAQVNVATNLGTTRDGSQVNITSSTGADITVAAATTTLSGVLTASDKTKLDGIETGATADQTKADIDALNINADQVDGLEASQFLRSDADDTTTGDITISKADPTLNLTNTTDSEDDFAVKAIDGGLYVTNVTDLRDDLVIDGAGVATFAGNLNASAGLDVTGNITVTGTVDGRDIATDGTKLDGIAAGAQVNVATNLGVTTTTTSNTITSSTGTNATIGEATGSAAGLMSTAHHDKLDGIAAGAQVNVATNLGVTTTTTSNTITSSTGTNATIGEATGSAAGLMSTTHHNKLDGIESGATADQTKADIDALGINAATLDSIDSSQFLRSDAGDTSTERIVFEANSTNNWDSINTGTGNLGCIEIKNNGSGTDAFMAFHVGGDFACYFGLDGGTNKISVGGWSMGANSYAIYHEGNKPSLADLGYTGATNANYITNNNQLTNGAGYITSSGSCASATNATNFNVAADNSTNATHYVTFTGGATGNQRPNSDTALTYNPSSNTLTAGTFSGALSGNATSATTATSASNSTQLNGQAASYYLNYNNFSNTPTIPTNNNQLTNGAGYITSSGNAATATWADTVDVNGGNTSSNWYDLVWHSGDTLYSTTNIECYPNGGYIRATYFNSTHSAATRSSDTVFYTSDDDYIRKNNATGTRASLNVPTRTGGDASGTWGINITGSAGTLGGYGWTTSGKNIRGTNIYADDWFRNYNAGEGLYNEATGAHFVSDSSGRWTIRDADSTIGIIFKTNGTTTRGYVYADDSSQIGFLNSSGSWSWKMDNSGNGTATGNVTAYSDINLKENIEVIPNALDKVEQLRGVTYNRTDIEGAPRHSGVIAQEVEVVLPEVVQTDEEGIKSVAYGNMVGLLIESIKELKSEVDSLKSEIKTLKGE